MNINLPPNCDKDTKEVFDKMYSHFTSCSVVQEPCIIFQDESGCWKEMSKSQAEEAGLFKFEEIIK